LPAADTEPEDVIVAQNLLEQMATLNSDNAGFHWFEAIAG